MNSGLLRSKPLIIGRAMINETQIKEEVLTLVLDRLSDRFAKAPQPLTGNVDTCFVETSGEVDPSKVAEQLISQLLKFEKITCCIPVPKPRNEVEQHVWESGGLCILVSVQEKLKEGKRFHSFQVFVAPHN